MHIALIKLGPDSYFWTLFHAGVAVADSINIDELDVIRAQAQTISKILNAPLQVEIIGER